MKKGLLLIIFGLFLISSCISQNNGGQENKELFNHNKFVGKYKPQVSVLGTFHFTNSDTHDYIDKYFVNTLSDKRQEELSLLLKKIVSFKPTKILVERNRIAYDSILNTKYTSYLNDAYKLDANDEVYQIAFPLGKLLGLEGIHCSDATAQWFGADLDWENFDEEEYLKSKQQYKKSTRYDYEKSYAYEDSIKSTLSILDYLKLINTPEHQLFNHQIYLTESVLSGAGDNYLGADSVARWYRRNLRIFSNVLDIVDFDKEERILIIYGASHVWTLKQFFEDSPDFEYIEINQFLEK